jgi:hypothetical protein
MSVCIVSLTAQGAVIGVDSKHTETEGDYVKVGVEKSLIRTFNGSPLVVAFAGDGKIGAKMVVDILADVEGDGPQPIKAFQAAILEAYKQEVANFAWKSGDDKTEFVENASVTLVCLDSLDKYAVTEVGPKGVYIDKSDRSPNVVAFGVKEVGGLVFVPNTIATALNMIGNVIADLCQKHPRCGLPAKIIIWRQGGQPEPIWIDTDEQMRGLASLA